MITLGKKIEALRKVADITQEKFAKKVGVSRQTVYRWEAGEKQPSAENLQIIANIFNISVDFFENDVMTESELTALIAAAAVDENNSVVENIDSDSSKTTESKPKKINIKKLTLIIITSILLLVGTVIVVILGCIVFSSNRTGDTYNSNVILNADWFFVVLSLVVIILISFIIQIILIIRKK